MSSWQVLFVPPEIYCLVWKKMAMMRWGFPADAKNCTSQNRGTFKIGRSRVEKKSHHPAFGSVALVNIQAAGNAYAACLFSSAGL